FSFQGPTGANLARRDLSIARSFPGIKGRKIAKLGRSLVKIWRRCRPLPAAKTAVPPPLAGRPAGRQTGGGTVPCLLYIHPGASTRMPDYKDGVKPLSHGGG